jgi:hypothetical protein
LWAFALTGQVQCQSVLVAGDVAKRGARVVVRTLRPESDATCHLRVRPDLAFEWFDLEDLVLEQHAVFIDSLLDRSVLAIQRCLSFLTSALLAKLKLGWRV